MSSFANPHPSPIVDRPPDHLNAPVVNEYMTEELRLKIAENLMQYRDVRVACGRDVPFEVEYTPLGRFSDSASNSEHKRYIDLRCKDPVGTILVGPVPCVGIKCAPYKGEGVGCKIGDNVAPAAVDLLNIPVTYRTIVWTSLAKFWPKASRKLFKTRSAGFQRGIRKWLNENDQNCNKAWRVMNMQTKIFSEDNARNTETVMEVARNQSNKHFEGYYVNKSGVKQTGIMALRVPTSWKTNDSSGGMTITCELKQITVDEVRNTRSITNSDHSNLLNQLFYAYVEIDDSTWRITKDFCGQRMIAKTIFYMLKPRYTFIRDMEFVVDDVTGKLVQQQDNDNNFILPPAQKKRREDAAAAAVVMNDESESTSDSVADMSARYATTTTTAPRLATPPPPPKPPRKRPPMPQQRPVIVRRELVKRNLALEQRQDSDDSDEAEENDDDDDNNSKHALPPPPPSSNRESVGDISESDSESD